MSKPPSRLDSWSPAQDRLLKAAVARFGMFSWKRVGSLFPGKTTRDCKARYQFLANEVTGGNVWTPDDDQRLLELVSALPGQWESIGGVFGRSGQACLKRFRQIQAERSGLEAPSMIGARPEHLPAVAPVSGSIEESDEKMMLATAEGRFGQSRTRKETRRERDSALADVRRRLALQRRARLEAMGVKLRAKRSKPRGRYTGDPDVVDVDGVFEPEVVADEKFDEKSLSELISKAQSRIDKQKSKRKEISDMFKQKAERMIGLDGEREEGIEMPRKVPPSVAPTLMIPRAAQRHRKSNISESGQGWNNVTRRTPAVTKDRSKEVAALIEKAKAEVGMSSTEEVLASIELSDTDIVELCSARRDLAAFAASEMAVHVDSKLTERKLKAIQEIAELTTVCNALELELAVEAARIEREAAQHKKLMQHYSSMVASVR